MGSQDTTARLRKELAEERELTKRLARALLEDEPTVADAIEKALGERDVAKRARPGIPTSGAGTWGHLIGEMHAASKARKARQ